LCCLLRRLELLVTFCSLTIGRHLKLCAFVKRFHALLQLLPTWAARPQGAASTIWQPEASWSEAIAM